MVSKYDIMRNEGMTDEDIKYALHMSMSHPQFIDLPSLVNAFYDDETIGEVIVQWKNKQSMSKR